MLFLGGRNCLSATLLLLVGHDRGHCDVDEAPTYLWRLKYKAILNSSSSQVHLDVECIFANSHKCMYLPKVIVEDLVESCLQTRPKKSFSSHNDINKLEKSVETMRR